MAKRNRLADVQKAQVQAMAFMRQWLTANALPLPAELSDEKFEALMDTISRGLAQAYVKGYIDAASAKS